MKYISRKIGLSLAEESAFRLSEVSSGLSIPLSIMWLREDRTEAILFNEVSNEAVNFFIETDSPFIPVQAIVGDAVFVRFKEPVLELSDDADPELADLSAQDIENIADLLSEERQIELLLSYFLYGG